MCLSRGIELLKPGRQPNGQKEDLNVVVEVEAYWDGESWCARGIRESIYTHGATLDSLWRNIREAVNLHLEGENPTGEPIEIELLIKADAAIATG